ncbi:MAG: chain-length determining protein [Rhizobiaceae bacterium]|nr:chain-length determining protein [Rhizobiaceae bacterium]
MGASSMAGEHELNRDIDVDLGGIFGSIWRNKFRLLVASIVVTAITFMVLQVISPRYRSEARILIQASDTILTGPRDNTSTQIQTNFDDPAIASQVQLLQSRAIAQKISNSLDLKSKSEFDPALNRSRIGSILSSLGLSDNNSNVTAEDRVLETYFDKLEVFQADNARVIVVRFWSEDPELAAAVPNMITEEYLKLQEELKRGANPEELEQLEPELKALREGVMKAEAAAAEFRQTSDLLQGRDNDTLATQELSELSTELSRVRSQLSRAEANAASINQALQSGSLDAATSVLQSPLIQRLRERQVTLDAQLSDLQTSLLPGHPRVQRLKSQLERLSEQIRDEAKKITTSLQREAEVARAREADLIQQRNVLKSEAGRVGKAQVQLRALEREADAQRELLNSYLLRFREAESRQNREFLPADAYVFAKAQVQSKPYFPKKLPTLAGAFFGTLILGSVITLAAGVLSGTTVRQTYGQPFNAAGSANGMSANAQRLHMAQTPPLAPTMDSLQGHAAGMDAGAMSMSVASETVSMMGHGRIAVLAPEAGKRSLTAIVLARALAAKPASVIVVDMTGSATPTQAMLGHQTSPGIKDLLAGVASFADTLHCDRSSNAHIMASGNSSAQMAAQSAAQLPMILDALQQTYEYVIVDCGSADVGGLSRVSNIATVNILDVSNTNNPLISIITDKLLQAGFKAPLIVKGNAQAQQAATGFAV